MINGRFKIVRKIGEGRCKVFLASDKLRPYAKYAIKLLQNPFTPEEEKIFKKEFLLLEKINYPNIIKVSEYETILEIDGKELELDINIGSKFFVMEYFNGKNLLEYAEDINEETLSIIISQICQTLYYLHQSNYIYCDLKPENILVKTINGNPQIKLIDFGFVKRNYQEIGFQIQGSAEYLAPEILRKEKYDHRCDFYSLGIILYRIIYKKFPFKTGFEVDIYKAHLEDDFKYPKTKFSDNLVSLIKKLLAKNSDDRFLNALEILGHLKIDVEDKNKNFFIPVGYFSGREEIIKKVRGFLSSDESSNLLLIKGTDGSGKTSVARCIKNEIDEVFYLDLEYSDSVVNYWKNHLRSFILQCNAGKLGSDSLRELIKIIEPGNSISLEQLKQYLIKFSRLLKFTLLIDDFNKLDELNLEFLKQLLPIFFSNNIKIILVENTNLPSVSLFPMKADEIYLPAFDKSELELYLDNNFARFFPVAEFKDLLIQSSDFDPGNVINCIKEAIEFGILDFNSGGPFINTECSEIELLKSSQEEIINLKINKLEDEETRALEILSAFNININVNVLAKLLATDINNLLKNLQKLVGGNFVSVSKTSGQIHFTSNLVKHAIYKRLSFKEKFHLSVAEKITENLPDFKKAELARQFELGKEYQKAFATYLTEISEANKLSAFSYIKDLLVHMLTLPLDEEKIFNVKSKLSNVLIILGDSIKALEITDSLLNSCTDENFRNELLIQRGQCQISLGNISEGIEQLNKVIPRIQNGMKLQLMLDIAGAYIDISKFEEAAGICDQVINNNNATIEEKANAFSLNGLINIYQNGNFDNAILNYSRALTNFQKVGNVHRIARMELNLGNIYNIRGETLIAQKYWNDSLQRNLSVGNLEQEAKLLVNFGINYYNELDFELALENYKRAQNIFLSLGDPYGEGLALLNQGECYLAICEYQLAIDSLTKAQNLFHNIKNHEAEAEVLFLFGELYYRVNCISRLELTTRQLGELVEEKVSIEKHKNNFSYLNQLIAILKGDYENVVKNFIEIKDKYIELDENQNFIASVFTFCEVLIRQNDLAAALKLLNEEKIMSEIVNNKFNAALREYYLGKISMMSQHYDLNVSIEYFENVYQLLETESINELLCRVMFEIALYYFERGNFRKAEDHIFYCKNLIYFIADKFTNGELKRSYLAYPLRKSILNNLKRMEDKI
jgi:myosin-light-chain kinase